MLNSLYFRKKHLFEKIPMISPIPLPAHGLLLLLITFSPLIWPITVYINMRHLTLQNNTQQTLPLLYAVYILYSHYTILIHWSDNISGGKQLSKSLKWDKFCVPFFVRWNSIEDKERSLNNKVNGSKLDPKFEKIVIQIYTRAVEDPGPKVIKLKKPQWNTHAQISKHLKWLLVNKPRSKTHWLCGQLKEFHQLSNYAYHIRLLLTVPKLWQTFNFLLQTEIYMQTDRTRSRYLQIPFRKHKWKVVYSAQCRIWPSVTNNTGPPKSKIWMSRVSRKTTCL